ncbi:MAG: MerR family transcriptional regulator [Ruminococcaceae bacterium]|nr:MerR family transcriptional regulator [Oscillospiraceae bacterium]
MKMKEICERSGLTERAVRLYCERGLVHPEKYSERGREYLVFSDHNLRELAIVSELRHADFSLDEIALMLERPEKCGDVLAGWRGRVTEQNQRLTQAKDKLAELSSHDQLSAERIAEQLGAKTATHGASPYHGETFAEFCERNPWEEMEYSAEILEICAREEKRERFGKRFLIIYCIFMAVTTLFSVIINLLSSGSLLSAVISIAVFVLLITYLLRGAAWARVVAIISHIFGVFSGLWRIQDLLPGARLGIEYETGMDGTVTFTEQLMPQGLGIFLTTLMVIAVALDCACIYMLWFHKGVKDYLYDRSL